MIVSVVMSALILVAAVIIWFLSYYPRTGANVITPENIETTALAQSENSYLGRIGKLCEPVMKPLGLDWRASVALLSGAVAKEIILSTLSVLYSVDESDSGAVALSSLMLSSGNYSRAAALAFMIFILLYFPCIATVATIAREAGGWKWALFSVLYNTLLAWVLAFAAYNIGIMIGL